MKSLFRIVAALILLSAGSSGQSSKGEFEYLSPLPGSAMASRLTNIILRPSLNTGPRRFLTSSALRVTGDRSGVITGTLVLSDDSRTLVFKPGAPFAAGETVTVEILPGGEAFRRGAGTPFTFSFSVSRYVAEARPTPDDQEPAFQRFDATHSAAFPQDALPPNFPTVTVTQSNNPSPGYLFLSNMTMGSGASNSPYVMILDNSGHPVFYRPALSDCTDFKVQPNGLLTYNDSYLHCFLALDSSYAVVDTFRCGNGYLTNWHELRLLPNGHALILGDDPQIVRMDTIVPGGDSSALVMGIVIQELDQSKNVVFQWRTFDHFKITDATHEDLKASYIEPFHSNAIEADTDGNLMLSSRHMDEITKINRQTGDIIWRWGGKNNQFTFVNDSLGFRHQHAIRRLPNGDVSLFDNGDFRFPLFSRGVEYSLDEQNKKATLVWQFRHHPDIYAPAMGYMQRLSNGNTLIGWGAADTTLTEVRSDGTETLELKFPYGIYSYRAYRFPWSSPVTSALLAPPLPRSFSLEQNYPNPFNPSTVIGYRIPGAATVTLRVVDLLGRTVATLVNGRQEAGYHTAILDGSALASGVYFYRLESGTSVAVKSMLLVK